MTEQTPTARVPEVGATAAPMRALPTRVRPLSAETPEGYLHRLARANSLEPDLLWAHLRSFDNKLPTVIEPQHNPGLLEAVAGLPAGWFASDARRNLVPCKCEHNGRKTAVCESCSTIGMFKPGCVRCTAGAPTDVRSIGGPICLKHNVWCTSERAWPLSRGPEYVRAEHQLRTVLHQRGVGIDTGELQIAQHLLASWAYSGAVPDRIVARKFNLGGHHVFHDAWGTVDPWLYPETVALATVLTHPDMTALILSPRWSEQSRAIFLVRAIGEVTDMRLPMGTVHAAQVLTKANDEAMQRAYQLVTARRKPVRPITPALMKVAGTHHAHLLRHVDARVLPRPDDEDFNFYGPVNVSIRPAPAGLPYRWLPRPVIPLRSW